MPSTALSTWTNERCARLDELVSAHRLVGGTGPGRRWRTVALNEALVLRLAAEFQGFARDLHEVAARQFAFWASPNNRNLETVIRNRLSDARELDRGNANPGSIGKDFARFGFDVWPALVRRDPASALHNRSLAQVNAARNALAHSDPAGLAILRSEGTDLFLATFRRWRRHLDALASNLDVELADRLASLFGQPQPW
jgi:hypothetical protein